MRAELVLLLIGEKVVDDMLSQGVAYTEVEDWFASWRSLVVRSIAHREQCTETAARLISQLRIAQELERGAGYDE